MSYVYRCQTCGVFAKSMSRSEDQAVRSIIVCDGCGAETDHDIFDLPRGWMTLNHEDGNEKDAPYVPTEHYCSRVCLRRHEMDADA